MTDRTLQLLEERRRIKSLIYQNDSNKNELARLNREIKRACRDDKNKHINEECEELERHANRYGETIVKVYMQMIPRMQITMSSLQRENQTF
ncbi:unnamed protein product [Diabrotica balteata]|uniref:Uncharacterized protein n=1 Tax=Diabrotica balteata TaxID=107213 RepID=A0A9N9XKB4_DIABA|nr:unnamed protein product [Diabrotica balteata]